LWIGNHFRHLVTGQFVQDEDIARISLRSQLARDIGAEQFAGQRAADDMHRMQISATSLPQYR